MTSIFDGCPLESDALIPLYKQLLGLEGFKPFECVGTPEETKAAFLMIHEADRFTDTPVMQLLVDEVLPSIENAEALKQAVLASSDEHALPDNFQFHS